MCAQRRLLPVADREYPKCEPPFMEASSDRINVPVLTPVEEQALRRLR